MKLVVEHPETYKEERGYILSLLMQDFLGLDIDIKQMKRSNVRISTCDGRELIIADKLFVTPSNQWLTPISLPHQPLKIWDLSFVRIKADTVNNQIPVIFGGDPESANFIELTNKQINLMLDIFGSSFFMLTRYEEIVKIDRDQHDRFPVTASIALQEGFLDRPIVNEYLEILWACLQYLWPNLRRKTREYRLLLSHDVDQPLCVTGKPLTRLIRRVGGDILRRRDIGLAARSTMAYIYGLWGNFDRDPCNTFDFIMNLSEKYNVKSTFHFMTAYSSFCETDRRYKIDDPWFRKLIRSIHERGHELGLHTNYDTFRDKNRTNHEFEILLDLTTQEGICQKQWGSRQHYLRWDNPATWQNLEDAGLNYDSTLTFADHIGFRCGTCYEYPVFNLITKKILNLIERPLIVMDGAFLYMKMSLKNKSAINSIIRLNQICKCYKGSFTLLWHNSSLITTFEKHYYSDLLKSLAE